MRVLFVYANIMGIPYIDFGIASLSAFLKSRGHRTGLVDFTFGLDEKAAIRMARGFRPDMVCFSSRSNEFEHVAGIAGMFKRELGVPIFCGGTHPTIAPDDALRECFDGICIGEGEEALSELAEKMEKGRDYLDVRNFWFRNGKRVIKNPVRPAVQDLDELPLFDYGLFDMQRYLKARDGQIDYIGMRGCPFRCSYCVNHVLQELYRNKGRYVRLKSVDRVIRELKELKERYRIKNIFFIDEVFNISDRRLEEFSGRYPGEIGLPFQCSVRADLCNDKNMDCLKRSNCTKICIAIESGDEKLRNSLLDKNISDESIINAFRLAKKYGIHALSYNMIGLPLETPEQIEKTIDINKRAGVDSLQVSIFAPFAGTKLYEYCKKNGLLLDKKMDISYYFGNYLKNPNLAPGQLERYRKWFSYKCYEDRSRIKATLLLMRDMAIPFYLKYGKYMPVPVKRMIYYLFWNTKVFKFLGK